MSIAVSAMLRPSRRLALMVRAMACLLLLAGLTLWWQTVDGKAVTRSLAAVCAIAAAGLALFPLAAVKFRRIDVTGLGQILLTHTDSEAVGCRTGDAVPPAEVVQLLRDSTLWSSLMVLRLQTVSGRTYSLVLLPDSMDREAFLALSVACRWVASRSGHADA